MPILLLDKGKGLSSYQAISKVKRLFGYRKAGHGGTLDPLASGMLPVFFGTSTIFSKLCLQAKKTYTLTCHLGIATTTYDAEGEVVYRHPAAPPPTIDDIATALDPFLGTYAQTPPLYSARKVQGKRLYKLARSTPLSLLEQASSTLPTKVVSITLRSKLDYRYPELSFTVECSSGTYVRSLVSDLGGALQCGAHITQLRRVAIDSFDAPMYSAEQIADMDATQRKSILIAPESINTAYPKVRLQEDDYIKIIQGQKIASPVPSADEGDGSDEAMGAMRAR